MQKKAICAVDRCNRQCLINLFKNKRFHMGNSVLEGIEGLAYADNVEHPKFAILLLKNYCFLSGEITRMELEFVMETFHLTKYEIITTDNIFLMLKKIYKQKFICSTRYSFEYQDDFDQQRLLTYIANLSSNYCLKKLDADMAFLIQDSHFMNVSKNYYENGIGVYCIHEHKIIGVASSNIVYKKGIEVNIKVDEKYRKQGVALAMASSLILLCINEKKEISWDAANVESLLLAEKLGFVYHSSYPVCAILSFIKEF